MWPTSRFCDERQFGYTFYVMKEDITELQLMSMWCHGIVMSHTWRQMFANMKKDVTDTSNLWWTVYFTIWDQGTWSGLRQWSWAQIELKSTMYDTECSQRIKILSLLLFWKEWHILKLIHALKILINKKLKCNGHSLSQGHGFRPLHPTSLNLVNKNKKTREAVSYDLISNMQVVIATVI